ncbi:hypothetical protein BCL69_100668 [Nitrosomonas communis]|uniref:Uncharacterized protein n=1 Tax=Nitrosomonas communis TaxID=44574 RepID=A0A1H2RXG4_9PROT|nr:hypothetical protein BCL69_100668 [Nitrosomonas communis]SDW23988.1 hypothetical protein SAMN05421882_1005129 [Nitrosomonas communis]
MAMMMTMIRLIFGAIMMFINILSEKLMDVY